ncbi:hypothetical protein JZ751_016812 [Albula glossodonta]|uniref:Uncharacterized protein n=1 Tax=Albula glossodonta TaxID=121402 RepID=A0A8T2NT24_9TELE|nr:hypothetical protein JZ751_016812 [Albula glossodonta]
MTAAVLVIRVVAVEEEGAIQFFRILPESDPLFGGRENQFLEPCRRGIQRLVAVTERLEDIQV